MSNPSCGQSGAAFTRPNPHEKRAGILALLDRDPGTSARGIAREIGIDHRDVHFPACDEVREHTEITRTVAGDVRQIELAEAAAAVEAKLDQCRDRGRAPTMRALQSAATSASLRLTYAEQQQVVSQVLAAPAASAP